MKGIVVLSLEPWDGVWRRNQYLFDGMLRSDPDLQVLFVEPSRDHLHAARTGAGFRRARGLRRHPDHGGRLWLYEPAKVLPRAAGPAADALLRAGLARAMRRAGLRSGVLWVNDPSWAGIIPRRGFAGVYDITDDWLAADRGARELARTSANERRLMARADAVIVCSRVLAERRRAARSDVHLVANAVDVVRYRTPAPRPADLPAGPVGLYVGTLHEDRLDVDLVARTAATLHETGGAIVLLGPDALSPDRRARLAGSPGVVLAGPRPHLEVPAYLQHADVLLVPHVVDAFTESLDPIKMYEYLAVGRPVVSTPVAGFRDLGDESGVTVASAADFPSAAVTAARASATVTAARLETWDDRVAQVTGILSGIAPGGPQRSRRGVALP